MILSGWKEIAAYMHCGIRSAQRWERDGLPVHRLIAARRSAVIARSEELDRWIRKDQFSHPRYPELIAAIANAQRLQDQTRVRVTELQTRVAGLQAQVADLQTRRSRNPSASTAPPAQLEARSLVALSTNGV